MSITLPLRIFATLKVTSDITNHNTVLQCLPETLHFPDTGGLKLQAKVFLSEGELGLPGSTYVTESVVKQEETGRVVYKATGTFILNPIKFLATEFRYAIANKEFEVLWKKLDINGERTLKGHLILSLMMMPRLRMTVVIHFSLITGDGVVSREELQQFVRSSGMAELDDKEFDSNGVLSFEEVTDYFHSLHLGIKEDFSKSVAKYLKGGSTRDELATLWSKLDTNGDGVVSLEDLDLFITSEINEFSRNDASFLHRAIDSNSDGAVSFSEFKSYLHSLKPSVCLP